VPKDQWDERYYKREEYLLKKIEQMDAKKKENNPADIKKQ